MNFLAKILPLLGSLICFVWFLLAKRTLDHATYFIQSSREIEEKHLSDIVQTVARGAKFSQGNKVTIYIDDPDKIDRLSLPGRIISGQQASYIIILAFIIIYLIILTL